MPPSELRNTLATEAINGGWMDYHVRRYLGHAPVGIAERHYHAEWRAKAKRGGHDEIVERFREKVVSRIDQRVSFGTTLAQNCKVIALAGAHASFVSADVSRG